MPKNPKVFISYAHKNQEYEDKVLDLANRLRSEGIDAMIDQYEEAPAEGWPRWMERQIAEAEFVVILCEETYHRKLYSEQKGKGVVWEANIVYQFLYDATTETRKFIPAFFEEKDQQFIPTPLKSFTFYNLSDERQYERLYWRFRGVTNTKKPPVGKLKPVPAKERKTMFVASPIHIENWDKAKWRGIVYLWGEEIPVMGLFFLDYHTGKEIFKEWKNLYKGSLSVDSFLRVDYVIPPFPKDNWIRKSFEFNNGKGYFVHIGPNMDATIGRAHNDGYKMADTIFALISRYRWMDEVNGTQNREHFMRLYNKAKKFYLVPVGLKDPFRSATMDNMQFDFDNAILVQNLVVTPGTELKDTDLCKVVLEKPKE